MSDETKNSTSTVVEFKRPATAQARPDGAKKPTRREREREGIPAPPSASTFSAETSLGDIPDGLDSFIIGQHLICKVMARERNGYAVIVEGGIPGYLKCNMQYKIGRKVTAEFICFMDGRALMAELPETYQNSGLKSFGMLEEIGPVGAEIVPLFGNKGDSDA